MRRPPSNGFTKLLKLKIGIHFRKSSLAEIFFHARGLARNHFHLKKQFFRSGERFSEALKFVGRVSYKVAVERQ
jgi:hypothetical protein